MKNMKNMKNMRIGFIILLSSIAIIAVSPCTVVAEMEHVNKIEKVNFNFVRAADTVWKIKMINGKVYKRLWDETNQKWLTDWILVG